MEVGDIAMQNISYIDINVTSYVHNYVNTHHIGRKNFMKFGSQVTERNKFSLS